MRTSRRDFLQLPLAGALGPGLCYSAVNKARVRTRMFWTWDHMTKWVLNSQGVMTAGVLSPYYRRAAGGRRGAFLGDYTRMIRWCGRNNVDAIVVWGLLRDSHGGVEAVERLCEEAARHDVLILAGVGLNAYGGVYFEGDSPHSLERHLEKNPDLVAEDHTGKKFDEPMKRRACPSRKENQEYAQESLRWLFETLPLGGAQIETGDFGVCECELCRRRRRHRVSRFSWEDMALMYPLAAEAIRSVAPHAWIVCETYSHPEPYDGEKPAPDFGDGKASWADEAIAAFPKGSNVFVQWVGDEHCEPISKYAWTEAGRVSNEERRNIMRAHFSSIWRGHRGELAIHWIAAFVQQSVRYGFDAISLFGEVSPFETGAELNYLALENYGSAANPEADLDVFLRTVAAPLLGGEQLARDYLRYARLRDQPGAIPGALREIYARSGKLPTDAARRWSWLGNHLATFLHEQTDTTVTQ